METFLYTIFKLVGSIHSSIMTWNDTIEYSLTDKELHFVVIGIIGIVMIFIIHPIFLYLARKGRTMVISFLYVITVLIVISFAIEIGQGITGSGAMEFSDITYGIAGFLLFFLVFIIIRAIVHFILNLIRRHRNDYY